LKFNFVKVAKNLERKRRESNKQEKKNDNQTIT